jgi:uncharacterized protein YkwD
MSITLFYQAGASTGSPRSLRRLCIGATLALTLGACSGSGSSDDPVTGESGDEASPSTPLPPAMSAGDDTASTPSTPSSTDEDGPNVTDIDESTAPDESPPVSGEDEPEADPDAEAGSMSVLPAAASLVPDTDLCAPVADWDPAWVQFEDEVLLLVNEFRSQPADCGEEGLFEPAPPLTMNPILRCSARLHSLDMFERAYFDHDTPDGIDPFERMAEAGFVGSGGGENIARGQRSPEEVMAAWMDSDGHCANVMRAAFDTIGVGYHPGAGTRGGTNDYWTQNFGAPPFMRGGNRF